MNGRPELRFTVYGVARPKGSTRAFMPKGARFPIVTSSNKSLKGWEHTVRATLSGILEQADARVKAALYDAPICVTLLFHLPRPKSSRAKYPTTKPDLDKLVRGTLDALTGVIFRDDAQVVAIGTKKRYADGAAKLDVIVESWA